MTLPSSLPLMLWGDRMIAVDHLSTMNYLSVGGMWIAVIHIPPSSMHFVSKHLFKPSYQMIHEQAWTTF